MAQWDPITLGGHYRKTLPPNVFKFGPLPNAHITSENHCHWHLTCKIDWKIHALHKKSLYTAQLTTPKHKRITRNLCVNVTLEMVLLPFHFELPRDFSCVRSCRMRCAFVPTVFLVLFTLMHPPTGQKNRCPPTPEDNFWNSPEYYQTVRVIFQEKTGHNDGMRLR